MADRRRILLRGGLLAAVTAGAGLLAANPDRPAPRQVASPQPPRQTSLDLPVRRGLTPPGGKNLFGTPAPPPPPPPPRIEYAAQPPPAPVAPPLPFTFVGTFEAKAGEVVYYLGEADKVHAVKVGQAVNGAYRVESAAADRLELVYLPLDIKQTLVFGKTK